MEAIERYSFLLKNTTDKENSIGCAAHYTKEQAIENAISELVENHCLISTWLEKNW
ncbi:hypothetical protein [Paenibacillus sp. NPDC055715]